MSRPALGELLEATSLQTRARERAERVLSVVDELAPLLPDGGLPRGAATEVSDAALMIQLAAGAAQQRDVFTAAVDLPDLGLAAAVGAGIPLERLLLVDDTAGQYAEVIATLAPVCAIIMTDLPIELGDRQAARLEAHLRRHGTVLLAYRGHWPGARLRLDVRDGAWEGLGAGWGQLRRRMVTVSCSGRGAAGRTRTARLVLPDEQGRVSLPAATSAPFAGLRPAAGL